MCIHVHVFNVLGDLKNLMGILTGKGGSINLEQVCMDSDYKNYVLRSLYNYMYVYMKHVDDQQCSQLHVALWFMTD